MKIVHHFLPNGEVYSKEIQLGMHEFVVQHKHDYDHFGILAKGRVVVIVDGKPTVFGAGSCIPILADQEHMITALVDSIWFCVHHTNEKDPDKVDESVIQQG